MTRNDALEALDEMYARLKHLDGMYCWDNAKEKIRQALTAQPSPDVECVQKMHELESPDVEAIKREVLNEYGGNGTVPRSFLEDIEWVIDYLSERNMIAQAVPELPPRPQAIDNGGCKIDVYDLPRYGLSWNGPNTPVSTPMPNGYWTPFHLAVECCERAVPEIEGLDEAIDEANHEDFQDIHPDHEGIVIPGYMWLPLIKAARSYAALQRGKE